MFNAFVVRELEDQSKSGSVEQLEINDLPKDGVLIDVKYSTLNYKDGLALTHGKGVVKSYPHVPGVDFCGSIAESNDSRYKIGDDVIVSGWRVGEIYWGGYSQKARVNPDFLVPLPKGLTHHQAMGIGTAGLTAMLGILALEKHDITPDKGPLLVTGAGGGVGSVAVALGAKLGYEVHAVSGRETLSDYLKSLGASQIVAREDINETVKRPLESETWAGVIDNVGGDMLSRILGQMKYNGAIASIGLAGGTHLNATVIPFLLRGVNLLGIDSVMCPYEKRVEAWERLVDIFPFELFDDIVSTRPLRDLKELGPQILKGEVTGRTVIDVNA